MAQWRLLVIIICASVVDPIWGKQDFLDCLADSICKPKGGLASGEGCLKKLHPEEQPKVFWYAEKNYDIFKGISSAFDQLLKTGCRDLKTSKKAISAYYEESNKNASESAVDPEVKRGQKECRECFMKMANTECFMLL